MRIVISVGLALLLAACGGVRPAHPVPSPSASVAAPPAAPSQSPAPSVQSSPLQPGDVQLDGYPALGQDAGQLPRTIAGVEHHVERHDDQGFRVYTYTGGAWQVIATADDGRVSEILVEGKGPLPWSLRGITAGATLSEAIARWGPGYEMDSPSHDGTQEYLWRSGTAGIVLWIRLADHTVVRGGVRSLG